MSIITTTYYVIKDDVNNTNPCRNVCIYVIVIILEIVCN